MTWILPSILSNMWIRSRIVESVTSKTWRTSLTKTNCVYIRNFDTLKKSVEKIDFVGCSLPWDADIVAGPNAMQFLKEQSEHVDLSHIYIKESSSSVTNKQKSQTTLTGPSLLINKPTLSRNIDKINSTKNNG